MAAWLDGSKGRRRKVAKMRYLLLVLLSVFAIGCGDVKQPAELPVQEKETVKVGPYYVRIIKFTYEDHDYIYFKHGERGSFVLDPNGRSFQR